MSPEREPLAERPPASDVRRTPSGLELPAFYEVPGDGSRPGEPPYTRGIHPEMYRERSWTIRQYAGFTSTSATNRRLRFLLDEGQTGLSLAFDLPTQIGYDSDDPIALGEVGRVGAPISCVDDLDDLLAGIPLDRISLSMTINSTAPVLIAFLVVVARRRGVDLRRLRGTVQNDMLKEFIARRTWRFRIRPSLRLATDLVEWTLHHLPAWNPMSVSGYHIREAGATAIEEVALTIANALEYLRQARDRGLDASEVASRLTFFWSAHAHLFEEVAKLRAARRLWSRVLEERAGVTSARAARMRFHVQTAGSTLTWQEPENNIVRVTLQALAAALGGAQSIHTNGFDEALGLPSESSARLALRTQQILALETGLTDVADPLGGCPLVEDLTDRVERGALELLDEIERRGGALGATEDGYPQALIEESAWRWQRGIETGERPVVGRPPPGTTADAEAGAAPPPSPVRVDEQAEQERITRLAEHKRRRPAARVDAARGRLDDAARRGEPLMQALIECAEADVTVGEASATLARVFGEHRE